MNEDEIDDAEPTYVYQTISTAILPLAEAMTEFEDDYSSWIDVIATHNVSTHRKASESVRMYSTYKQTKQAVLKAKAEGVDVSNEAARLKEVGSIILREGFGLEEEDGTPKESEDNED